MKRNVSKAIDADVLEDKILVPSIPPSFLNGCNIIDISYILEVSQINLVCDIIGFTEWKMISKQIQ